MNRFSRVVSRLILTSATLAVFAGSLFAADTIELKRRWIAGKKYFQTIDSSQASSFSIGGQTMEQSTTTTIEISQAVRALPGGKGKRMTLKYDRMAMDMSMGGQKMSFDSSDPSKANDPLGVAKMVASVAGKELQILLGDNDQLTEIENYDDFVKQLGALPIPGMDLSKMYSKDAIAQMMNGQGLQSMPDHPVKPGDSWPYSTKIDLPSLGKVAVTGTYTLKGVSDHDGVRAAEIEANAKISMDLSGGDASNETSAKMAQLGMKVDDGSIKGTIWFDPALGTTRETELVQTMTMTMKDPTNPGATVSIPLKQNIHSKLTKVEDLK